jgi:hypothetical protein
VEVDGQSREKASLYKSDSQPRLRDWFRYTLIGDLFSASAVQIS